MTLTPRHVATLRAALQFWREEISPYGAETMRPYFESPDVSPLTTEEIIELDRLLSSGVRYAVCTASMERFNGTELFQNYEDAQLAAGDLPVVALFISPPLT